MHARPRQAPPSNRTSCRPDTAAPLDELRRLNIREVCALVGRSESSVRELIASGRFPKPDHRDGPRCVRWSAGLVQRWLQATTVQTSAELSA